MENFDFITDINFRQLLIRDYQELLVCLEAKASKSVLVLSGSIIEAVLIDYFLNYSKQKKTSDQVLKMSLVDMINTALSEGLISSSTKDLTSVIRNYRNLIHPGREIRTEESFDYDTANVAKSLLSIILKEVRNNYFKFNGYKAIDVVQKIEKDNISDVLFIKLVDSLHVTEKNKLADLLFNYEIDKDFFEIILGNSPKYFRIVVQNISDFKEDRFVDKLIYEITKGTRENVIYYYSCLHFIVGEIEHENRNTIIHYILHIIFEMIENDDAERINDSLFSITNFVILNDDNYILLKNIMVKLFYKYAWDSKNIYFELYDYMIFNLDLKTREYLVNEFNSYEWGIFSRDYNDYNSLPF